MEENDANLTEVQKCVERLQTHGLKGNSGNAIYLDLLRSNTARLLVMISGHEKARKHLASKTTRGIDVLLSLLENIEDVKVTNNVFIILKQLLTTKNAFRERCQIIVSHNGIHILLRALTNTTPHSSEEGIASLYTVLAKVGPQDRKFPVKARLVGTIPISLNHAKSFIHKTKLLHPILHFFQCILSNTLNSTIMGKKGLIALLLLLIDVKQKNSATMFCALEIMAKATRSKANVVQLVQQNGLSNLVLLLDPSIWSKLKFKGPKLGKMFRSVLQILLRISYTKCGREVLTDVQIAPCLLQWCRSLPVLGDNWDRLATLASLIIQKCLPPLVLPVASFFSPVCFQLPETSDSYQYCDMSNNGDAIVTAVDDNASPSNSDSDLDSDESDETFPDDDNSKELGSEDIKYFRKFFPELQCWIASEVKNIPSTYESHLEAFMHQFPLLTESEHSWITSKKLMLPVSAEINCSPEGLQDEKNLDNVPSSGVENNFIASSSDVKCSMSHSPELSSPKTIPVKEKDGINSASYGNKEESNFSPLEIRDLLNSAKEEIKQMKFLTSIDFSHIYRKMAKQTKCVYPLVKLSYPDLHGSFGCNEKEPLHQRHTGLYRVKILNHAGNRLLEHMINPRIVYDLDDIIKGSGESCFTSALLNNDDEDCIGKPITATHLKFESRFESGNLRKVIQIGESEYNLILNPDVNTTYHHQWFYFQVTGMKCQVPYTFNVINCEKANSLFNIGMNPLLYSAKEYIISKKGWMRTGWDVCYYRNHYVRDSSAVDVKSKPYYTLTFTVLFPHSKDVCYLAYHYPYTYSLLQTHLYCWEQSFDKSRIYCHRETLCESLAGNEVPVLTITALPVDTSRQYIFLTGRVHPGESNSSWVMKGVLDYILSNKQEAQKLREAFIFKIVPMLNPDGVINGCYRCSLSTQDLNRHWLSPCPKIHPTIYNTKALLQFLCSLDKKPMVYCDFHGHSRRQNVFLYGCSSSESWRSSDRKKHDDHICKVLPLILHHIAPAFSIENCSFTIEKSRESTGRITVWRQLGIPLSYTMECTYGGCDQGIYEGYHLGTIQMEEMGMNFCQALIKLIPNAESSPSGNSVAILDSTLANAIKSVQLMMFNKRNKNESIASSQSECDDDDDNCDDDYDDENSELFVQ